ncbi:MAG: nucleoside-diphosphate kinase [Chloroflexi bacterium]|nr:nucleoside-diphosphate kinase [Chloroflexota bacterium]
MERTLVIVKPDGVQRGLIGAIIERFERRGLRIAAMKMINIDPKLACKHYGEHEGKPFYPGLISFITSGPVVVMVLEGNNAIAVVRATMGSTNPANAVPGTIRADFGVQTERNLVHGSDGPESAHREIDCFFAPSEIVEYSRDMERWIYA